MSSIIALTPEELLASPLHTQNVQLWVYLGTSYRTLLQLEQGTLRTGRRIALAKKLQTTANRLRQPFLEFIDSLGNQKQALPWWAGQTAGKNPYHPLFTSVCFLSLAFELCETYRDQGLLLVFEHEAVLRQFRSTVFHSPEEDGASAGAIWGALAGQVHQLHQQFLRDRCAEIEAFVSLPQESIQEGSANPKEIALVTYVDEGVLHQDGRLNTRYYGYLPEWLQSQGYTVSWVPFIYQWSLPWKEAARRLRATSKRCYAMQDFLTGNDWQWCCAEAERYWHPTSEKADYCCAGIDISILVEDVFRESWAGVDVIKNLAFWPFLNNLANKNRNIAAFVLPYENQPWEKVFCLAARQFFPNADLIGYQHTTVPAMWLPYFPLSTEFSSGVLPKRVVCSGEEPFEILGKQGFQACTGAALRYEHIPVLLAANLPNPAAGARRQVLVVFPIGEHDSACLLHRLIKAFGDCPGIQVVLKPHPTFLPIERLSQLLPEGYGLPAHFSLETGPLSACLPDYDLMIFSNTSSAYEALAAGLPLVSVVPETFIDLDPVMLEKNIPGFRQACTSDELFSATLELLDMSQEQLQNHCSIAQGIARGHFTPVTEKGLREFIPVQKTPTASVIIPCYNYGRYLKDAVESVIRQTFQDFEIIIVNDGSSDTSKEVAELLIAKHTPYRIRLINQENSGQPAISRNNGIAVAQGRYILCIDADDKIAPSMLEECMAALENDPQIGIVYTDRQDFDGVDELVHAGDYNFDRLIYANHISYCGLYRKEIWEKIGGYRTNVKGVEDWDFWIAAGALGYHGKRIPKPLFWYRRHDTGVFQEVLKDYDRKFAQVILNNAQLYPESIITHANKLLQSTVVSVIVPTHNRPDMLKVAIQSILNQTFQDFEIIVINDGGQDVSSVIQAFASPKIIHLSHETNKGLAAARNTGIRAARGKYIAYLDDDDLYYPDHLTTLVQQMESDGSFVAYSDAHRLHLQERDGVSTVVGRDIPYSEDFDYHRILFDNFIPVLCVMHRKECLEHVGGFDPLLHRLEDWDLWIRMSRRYQFHHVPKVTCAFSSRMEGGISMSSANRAAFEWAILRVRHKYRHLLPQVPAAATLQAEFVTTAVKRITAALDTALAALCYAPRTIFGTDDLDEILSCASLLSEQHPEHREQMARLSELIKSYALLAAKSQYASSQADITAPLISVIVPTHNRPDMLKVAIKSIFDQTFQDFEIIIINDAGQDVSSVIQAFASPKITYLLHETNKGLAAARNTGIRAARGKYIAYLDDDDLYYPDHLETLITHLCSSGDKVAYAEAYRGIQEKRDGSFVTIRRERFPAQDFDYDEIFVDNFIPVLCIMHEKACLDNCGMFDETLPRHEDWDLWIRMSRRFRFAHISRLTCEYSYRLDGSGMTSGTMPMFLETYRRIYEKYRHLTAGTDIRKRQQRNFFNATMRVYNFLKEKMLPYISQQESENNLVSLFNPTGATPSQIKSVFAWLKEMASESVSIDLIEQSLTLAPDNHLARFDLFGIYINKHMFRNALEQVQILQHYNPHEPDFKQSIAELKEKISRTEPLIDHSKSMVFNDVAMPLKVVVYSVDPPVTACPQLRFFLPLRLAPKSCTLVWGTIWKPEKSSFDVDIQAVQQADIVVITRMFPSDETAGFINQILASGKPVIYETDDLLTNIPEDNPFMPAGDSCAAYILDAISKVALVTVSTEALREQYAHIARRIEVLPNHIAPAAWNFPSAVRPVVSPVTIGFAGGVSHSGDLEMLDGVLERIAAKYGNRVEFCFLGFATERQRRLPGFSLLEGSFEYAAYPERLHAAAIDIALAPLLDNPFNRCKSNIKWQEYSACGFAGIYVDLPPYDSTVEHGRTGLLVGQEPDQWYRAIELLIEHPEFREELAHNARQEVLKNYSFSADSLRQLEVYRQVLDDFPINGTVKKGTAESKNQVFGL